MTLNSNSGATKFPEIGWGQSLHATPNQRRDAVDNALWVGEPHIPGPRPQKSTSHISDPPFLLGLVHKTWTKALCTNSLSIVRGGFCPGAFVRGSFVWKVLSGVIFVRTSFCQNTSVTTES